MEGERKEKRRGPQVLMVLHLRKLTMNSRLLILPNDARFQSFQMNRPKKTQSALLAPYMQ
jgi:hypothetical protein